MGWVLYDMCETGRAEGKLSTILKSNLRQTILHNLDVK